MSHRKPGDRVTVTIDGKEYPAVVKKRLDSERFEKNVLVVTPEHSEPRHGTDLIARHGNGQPYFRWIAEGEASS